MYLSPSPSLSISLFCPSHYAYASHSDPPRLLPSTLSLWQQQQHQHQTTTNTTKFLSTNQPINQSIKVEKNFPDGKKEILFPDSTRKLILADGTCVSSFPDGVQVVETPDGMKEIKTRDGSKVYA